MDGILKAIQSLRGIFAPQKVISPLPASESPGGYNSPLQAGLNYYYQQQNATSQITPQQAQKNIQASSQPQTIQYPSWMANAPGGPNLASEIGVPSEQKQNAIGEALSILNPESKPAAQAQDIQPTPAVVSGVNQNFVDTLNKTILPITRQYGIPDAVAASQAGLESNFGLKPAALNNWFGLKAHSYPGFAHFNNIEDATRYYAQTVQSLAGGDLSKYKNKPLALLKAIQSGKQRYEGDNADPMKYVEDVSNTPTWNAYHGGQSMGK